MTDDQIQALRDRHRCCDECYPDVSYCLGCLQKYPCDVIVALDEVDRLKGE